MTFVKIAATLGVILLATSLGRKFPAVSALLVVMPLTSLIVITWLHVDSPGDVVVVSDFVRGALFGVLPTVLFFLVLTICFSHGWPFGRSMAVGLAVWAVGASVHQVLMN